MINLKKLKNKLVMEKINVAELLKDCPKGMKLDSTVFDNLTFDYVDTYQNRVYCKTDNRDTVWFTGKGCINYAPSAKCIIFPKGKTTWDGFVPPCKFKDGDIVSTNQGSIAIIYHKEGLEPECLSYCGLFPNKFDKDVLVKPKRLATEEEKQKLFDAIKANGYQWNAETKTLEKLIVPNKFDITTLKPFDKVLTRDFIDDCWVANFFGFYRKDDHFCCLSGGEFGWNHCIPYNDDTKHLLGTTDDCDEYYKTWE